jgi:hypothetical protein
VRCLSVKPLSSTISPTIRRRLGRRGSGLVVLPMGNCLSAFFLHHSLARSGAALGAGRGFSPAISVALRLKDASAVFLRALSKARCIRRAMSSYLAAPIGAASFATHGTVPAEGWRRAPIGWFSGQ